MKISIYIEKIEDNQMCYEVIKAINDTDLDCKLLYDTIDEMPVSIKKPYYNSEIMLGSQQDLLIINSVTSLPFIQSNYIVGKKILYVWDLEWCWGVKNYTELSKHLPIDYINRGGSHIAPCVNYFNSNPKGILQDFNIDKIVSLCKI